MTLAIKACNFSGNNRWRMLTEYYDTPLMRLDAANHQPTHECGAVGLEEHGQPPGSIRDLSNNFSESPVSVYIGIESRRHSLCPSDVALLFSVLPHCDHHLQHTHITMASKLNLDGGIALVTGVSLLSIFPSTLLYRLLTSCHHRLPLELGGRQPWLSQMPVLRLLSSPISSRSRPECCG